MTVFYRTFHELSTQGNVCYLQSPQAVKPKYRNKGLSSGAPNLLANLGQGALFPWSHMPGSGLKLRAQQTKRAAEQVETELLCCLFSLKIPARPPGRGRGLFHCSWHKSYAPRLVHWPANAAWSPRPGRPC